MSAAFIVIAFGAAINAARQRFVMPEDAATGLAAMGPLALGAAITAMSTCISPS